jgi:two-component system, OmpR family, response regulator
VLTDAFVFAKRNMNDPEVHDMLREDSKLLAQRVCEALDQIPDVKVVGTADTEAGAVAAVRAGPVDAMILDLQLREGTGFGVLRTLGKERPAVVVLTNFSLPTFQERARDLGVDQFLDKGKDFERLPDVIATIKTSLGDRPALHN